MERDIDSFNISLIEPEGYIHSGAFYELAELLCYSLKEIGCTARIFKNKFNPEAKNIIIGIHLLDTKFIQSIPKNSIIVNTEQLSSVYADWNENIIRWFSSGFELWDYSIRNIDYLRSFGVPNVKRLQIGYQKELRRIVITDYPDIDILFYGSLNERRKKILTALENKGLVVKVLFGVYGNERDSWIKKSKMVINHHFYDSEIFEVVRVFYLLTNSVAVVGEVNSSTEIEKRFEEGIAAAPFEEFVDKAVEIVKDKELLDYWRCKGFEAISKYPQSDFIRELI